MPPMTDNRLSFKEMCTRFEVTPRTLRYYEYIELLQPEKEGRSRFYTPREVARMTLILRGRRWGFSLEEIRQWLEIYEEQGTEAQMQAWVDMADRQLRVLADQQAQLAQAIEELKDTRDKVAREIGQPSRA
jgi:DNA-binding transcriptional MerR regulator